MPKVMIFLADKFYSADLGDKVRWMCIFFPSGCVGEGITFSQNYIELAASRIAANAKDRTPDVREINTNVYAFENLGVNYTVMGGYAVVGLLALWVIESGVLRFCYKFRIRFAPDSTRDFELDDDVVAEE